MRRLLLSVLAVLLAALLIGLPPAWAHANLLRSEPAAGVALAAAPATIGLWFTEPLESAFSGVRLLDSAGNVVTEPLAAVDPADNSHLTLTLAPGALPDGLYTVDWRVVSAADGHSTQGSYAFAVGAVTGLAALAAPDTETIPTLSAPVRWFDLLALALLVGGVSFAIGVAVPPQAERQMRRLLALGWILAGVAGLALLLYQAAQITGAPLPGALAALGTVLTGTRFGGLWIGRLIVWLVLGAALRRRRDGLALAAGAVILLLHTLYSHAGATYDFVPALASAWLHLAAAALWVGGLVQFLNVLLALRGSDQPLLPLVARFSQYARICVAAALVSGLYAAWLEVGSVAALVTTLYGRALLVKLILIVPLLGLAAVNLLLTPRGLRAGGSGWPRRLRGLVGAEIALAVGILAAVGVMTSADPARAALARRLPLPDHSFADYQIVDEMHVHFDVAPGWVGQNEFVVLLLNLDGTPIDDASLIRVRFSNQSQPVGQSELRPQSVGNGEYNVSGANLSVPGTWRARISVQRPGKFDTLVDFSLDVGAAPVPPGLDMGAPLAGRQWALLIAGLALLAVGGFAGGRGPLRPFQGTGLLATATIGVGLILLLGAAAASGLF